MKRLALDVTSAFRIGPNNQQQLRARTIINMVTLAGLLIALLGIIAGIGLYINVQNKFLDIGISTAHQTLYKWQRQILHLHASLNKEVLPADELQFQLDLVHSHAQIVQLRYVADAADALPVSALTNEQGRQALDVLYEDWSKLQQILQQTLEDESDGLLDETVRDEAIARCLQIEADLNQVIQDKEQEWRDAYDSLIKAKSRIVALIWTSLLIFIFFAGLLIVRCIRFFNRRQRLLMTLNKTNYDLAHANLGLSKMATIDELTQIANRRHFNTKIYQEWSRLNREKGLISIVLIDIDHFKAYNDRYGHQQGDRCLQQIAQALQQQVQRPGDLVARFGGEEFIILLPNTDTSGAVYVVEKVQQHIASLNIEHSSSLTSDRVTLCFGVATMMPQKGLSYEILIHHADIALYEAKKQGRDRYRVANIDLSAVS